MREERDLRLIGDEAVARAGELWRVLGAEPLANGEDAAVTSLCLSAEEEAASPFCCDCACCCLARAAAAADPGGGGMGILDAAEDDEGDDGGNGLLREILLRELAQAPVIERFILGPEHQSSASVAPSASSWVYLITW